MGDKNLSGAVHKSLAAAAVLLALSACPAGTPGAPSPMTALAATGPGHTDDGNRGLDGEYDEATAAALLDNVVEFSEIPSLIHEFNPTVVDSRNAILDSIDEAQAINDALAVDRYNVRELKEEAEDEGNGEAYADYASQEQIYKSAMKSYNSQIKSLTRQTSSRNMRQTEKQLTQMANAQMIAYESQRQQKESAEKSVSLYEEKYKIMQASQAAGLATADEVRGAQADYLGAKASLAQANVNLNKAYESLCEMIGREPDEGVVIAAMPDPDKSFADSIDWESDLQKAKNNNSTLVSTKHTSADTTPAKGRKKATIADGEEQVTLELKALLEQLKEAGTGLEAAELSWSSAQIKKQVADAKNAQGMASRQEYLEEELSYQESRASYEAAKLALTQAQESYKWAVEGFLSIEQ